MPEQMPYILAEVCSVQLGQLYDYLHPYYEAGLDAVIVQDMGVMEFIKTHFPNLPIHTSTQMTITNVEGARLLKEQGVERVVTAREMSLEAFSVVSSAEEAETVADVHSHAAFPMKYCREKKVLPDIMQHRF